MIIKRNGKFYKIEEKETELSEMEAMQERIAELEEKVRELEARPVVFAESINWSDLPRKDTNAFDHLYRPRLVTY